MFSGAMDILVIESPNKIFKSSAFHVRFGSLQVIKSKEQEIDIYVNSKKKNVTMKLSSSGDAYFQYDELDPYMIKQQNIYSDNILRSKKEDKNDVNSEIKDESKNKNKLEKEDLKKKIIIYLKRNINHFFLHRINCNN